MILNIFYVLYYNLYIFFGEMAVQILCTFFNLGCLFSYYWVLRFPYVFRIKIFIRYMIYKYFLPVCCWSFYSLKIDFQKAGVSNFNIVQLSPFFFWIVLLVKVLNIYTHTHINTVILSSLFFLLLALAWYIFFHILYF